MKIIDRYILRQFFINFVILLLVLMALFMVVDLIAGMDEFLQAGQRFADAYGGALPATFVKIVDYYGPVLVMIYAFCSGIPVIGAMGFTLASLQRNREAVAIVAGGVSLYRVAAPILIAGALLNAAVLPIQEFVLPPLAQKLMRSKPELKRPERGGDPLRLVPDEKGHLLTANTFLPSQMTLRDVTIHKRNERGLAMERITARRAVWVQGEQQSGWRLSDGVKHTFVNTAGSQRSRESAADFFQTSLSPDALVVERRSELYPWFLSMAQLWQMQSNPVIERNQQEAVITRIIWSRISLLVLNVLILVMGLAFFLQLGQRSLLMQGMLAAGVCLTIWGLGLGMMMTGAGWLNPVATAWLPVVLALPLSAALLTVVRT